MTFLLAPGVFLQILLKLVGAGTLNPNLEQPPSSCQVGEILPETPEGWVWADAFHGYSVPDISDGAWTTFSRILGLQIGVLGS